MPEELLPFDLEQYTRGRLSQTDPETVRALNAALAKARRFCGWHVTPVRTDTFTIDGHGGTHLTLPTRKVVSVDEVKIDGVAVIDYTVSAGGHLIRDQEWPSGASNIEITLTHGFTQAEAQDWREAVLRIADDTASQADRGGLTFKRVDDISYSWGATSENEILASLAPFRRVWLIA